MFSVCCLLFTVCLSVCCFLLFVVCCFKPTSNNDYEQIDDNDDVNMVTSRSRLLLPFTVTFTIIYRVAVVVTVSIFLVMIFVHI